MPEFWNLIIGPTRVQIRRCRVYGLSQISRDLWWINGSKFDPISMFEMLKTSNESDYGFGSYNWKQKSAKTGQTCPSMFLHSACAIHTYISVSKGVLSDTVPNRGVSSKCGLEQRCKILFPNALKAFWIILKRERQKEEMPNATLVNKFPCQFWLGLGLRRITDCLILTNFYVIA